MSGIAIAFMIIALVVEMSVLGYCFYMQATEGGKKSAGTK